MNKLKIAALVMLLITILSSAVYCSDSKPVELHQVNDRIWVHTSYQMYGGYLIPSNGLVAVTSKGLVMIDTCWGNESTKELIDICREKFKQNFVLAIITHGGHDDRIGGIDVLLKEGIEVISTQLTAEKARAAGFKQPSVKLEAITDLEIGDVKIETYYPGPGHSQDNIAVWFPGSKVLFGGCMIKSIDSKNLGNTADANVKDWPESLRNLLKRYPDANVVIPGHGNWGGIDLLYHTLELF